VGTLPRRYARAAARFKHGSGVCTVHYALSRPVPWAADGCLLAGTVHVVGSRAEAVAAARSVTAGRHPERPYVLVTQPGVVDASRAPEGRRSVSPYTHVPNGSGRDMTEAVTAQIERFAPGFRDVVLASRSTTAAGQQAHNRNLVGGDILGGAVTLRQTLLRPVARWDPYRTPLDGVYLCSASTPPGPGVHGMAGMHVAGRVLRRAFGITAEPVELLSRG
jgi:phytoene dehydrogenase-like protein